MDKIELRRFTKIEKLHRNLWKWSPLSIVVLYILAWLTYLSDLLPLGLAFIFQLIPTGILLVGAVLVETFYINPGWIKMMKGIGFKATWAFSYWATIDEVYPDSAVSDVGLLVGDKLCNLGGYEVSNLNVLHRKLPEIYEKFLAGEAIKVVVLRDMGCATLEGEMKKS
ncbi:MAG: hypothetical protein G01um101419_468 [Parcubacteria group bacterium Gr01-1014_19]|nr:MAG: hypothetical protein G01um101419_468 [Parcubacteria group bacterium Gr01-1014_19]